MRSAAIAFGCVVMVGLTAAREARAQQVDLNQFRPSEIASDGFAISTASDQGHMRFGAQYYIDYADDSLAFVDGMGGTAHVVKQQMTGHLVLSLGLWSRVVFYAGMPFHFMVKETGNNFDMLSVLPPNGGGLGDMWLGSRVRLFGTEQDLFQMALQGTLNIATASLVKSDQRYLGMSDRAPHLGGHPELLTTLNAVQGHLRFSLNLGYNIRPNEVLGPVNLGDELTFGFGTMYDFFRKRNSLLLLVEMFGRTGISSGTGSTKFGAKSETPLEVLGGLKYLHYKGISFGVGGGIGLIAAYGTPDYRVLGTIAYTMRDKKSKAEEKKEPEPSVNATWKAPVPVAAAVELDTDKDGVPDARDNCPREAGSAENSGCKKEQLVTISEGKIEISDKIYFGSNSALILPRSKPLLDNVAKVLKAHPEIKKIRVDAHTDARGSDAKNKKLSVQRAQSVVKYLVKKGVKKTRLLARGFGESQPLMPKAKTAEEHAENRRVEFTILP